MLKSFFGATLVLAPGAAVAYAIIAVVNDARQWFAESGAGALLGWGLVGAVVLTAWLGSLVWLYGRLGRAQAQYAHRLAAGERLVVLPPAPRALPYEAETLSALLLEEATKPRALLEQ